jgi:hypothetical protein
MSVRRNNGKLLPTMIGFAKWPTSSSKARTTDDHEDAATNATTETSESSFSPSSESSKCHVVVGFATTVRVRHTLSRDSYTTEEAQATWYTRDEYQGILKRCHKEIQKLNQGEVLLDQKYCARGLERHTQLATITRTLNKKQAVQAVLEEQRRQEEQDIFVRSEKAIAKAYQPTCSGCQLWARVIGNLDRHAVEDYLDDC